MTPHRWDDWPTRLGVKNPQASVVVARRHPSGELKEKYPTPEIDRAKKAIPGCSDELGA
ncbi:hypothetical protein [Mycobacterium sp.]|uniref:hypothetical protein n=1 Tax=Mycobacterium sp. TaxID=1785 RepID=UPI003C730A85